MKEWLNDAVFYEIYPQSFCDSNADGIGDFNGIISKLDYIKNLGFNAIWLNPCYTSPFMDAGYDVEDYYTIAPRYGTNEDAKKLFNKVHELGMHIILDLVPGHTSDKCKWFKESCKAEKNKYSGRYIWTDCAWVDLQNVSGISGSLRGISDRDGSCGVNFFSTQPALNYGFAEPTESWQCSVDSDDAVSTRKEIINIIKFWLKLGCDGFRVDMAGSLVKNDTGQKETIKLWQKIFSELGEEFSDAVFVSEWGEPEKALEAGFDMDFMLHFGSTHYMDLFRTDKPYFSKKADGDASLFFYTYTRNREQLGDKGYMCIPSGNHDMMRIGRFLDYEELKIAYAFLMSMPGVPFIYYGDEIGMDHVDGLVSVEGGYDRTGSRSPMHWDNSANAGFSSAPAEMLYIPQCLNNGRTTVEEQKNDESSLLNELKKQIDIRHKYPALKAGAALEHVFVEKGAYPIIYKRSYKEQSILVIVNPSDEQHEYVSLSGSVIYEYNGAPSISGDKMIIPPRSASYILMDN